MSMSGWKKQKEHNQSRLEDSEGIYIEGPKNVYDFTLFFRILLKELLIDKNKEMLPQVAFMITKYEL